MAGAIVGLVHFPELARRFEGAAVDNSTRRSWHLELNQRWGEGHRGKHMRVILATMAMLALASVPSSACSCLPATPEQMFGVSTAVFAGQVLAIRDTVQKNWMGRPVRVLGIIATMRVDLAWKGTIERQAVQLFVPPDGGECGFRMSVGELWIMYATRVPLLPEMLQTSLCARPSRLDLEGEDFLWLKAQVATDDDRRAR
jgi:hypothetical protein